MAPLSIRGVLGFFDGAVATECAHSNSINALLGEELGLGLQIHYLSATLFSIESLPLPGAPLDDCTITELPDSGFPNRSIAHIYRLILPGPMGI
jgi:hypothetical protein